MRKISYFIILVMVFALPIISFAQETAIDNHTKESEAKGELIQKNLRDGSVSCEGLSDDDFHSLGMYFMGLMTGNSHEAMDEIMESEMGKDGEVQMHVVMGKKMSGCDTSAEMPSSGMGFISMMNMMSGGMMDGGGTMMGGFGTSTGWFGLGWIFMILFWVLIIVGIVALVKWITTQGKGDTKGKTAPDILKERYAKGEIDKQEFEEKKKDLM